MQPTNHGKPSIIAPKYGTSNVLQNNMELKIRATSLKQNNKVRNIRIKRKPINLNKERKKSSAEERSDGIVHVFS